MNLNDLIRSLPLIGRPSSILVCETDGFNLRGAVIAREGNTLNVKYAAKSEQVEFPAAVDELLSLLRQQGWQGKEAILLTPGVFSTLVELPVSPREPRTALQMQEMIRWELEPMLLQHNMLSSVGQILQKLGYINETQAAEILERQQNRHKESGQESHIGSYAFKRYCELAIEMGYITQAQRDECLSKHAWLRSESEDFLCGWRPQIRQETTPDDELMNDGAYTWLASGANKGMVQQWEAAFAAGKVILQEVYPYLGCAVSLVDAQTNGIVIECNDGMVSGMHVDAGIVTGIKPPQRTVLGLLNSAVEAYHALIPPEPEQIWLAVNSEEQDKFVDDLQSLLNHKVQVIAQHGMEYSAGMMGAAHDYFRMPGAGNCCSIVARGPRPPAFKRVEVRAIAAGVAILTVIAALEVSLLIRNELVADAHARISATKKELDDAVNRVQTRIDAVQKVKDEIKAKQDELNALQARIDFFSSDLAYRTMLVWTMLEKLVETVGEDVLIDAVEETPSLGFRIAGWAMTENSAQQFIQAFKAAMEPLEMDVSDPIVRSQAGPLGLLGYNIHFRLVEVKGADGQPANSSQATVSGMGGQR